MLMSGFVRGEVIGDASLLEGMGTKSITEASNEPQQRQENVHALQTDEGADVEPATTERRMAKQSERKQKGIKGKKKDRERSEKKAKKQHAKPTTGMDEKCEKRRKEEKCTKAQTVDSKTKKTNKGKSHKKSDIKGKTAVKADNAKAQKKARKAQKAALCEVEEQGDRRKNRFKEGTSRAAERAATRASEPAVEQSRSGKKRKALDATCDSNKRKKDTIGDEKSNRNHKCT